MYRNGQQIIAHLGEDRHLYINRSPGKSICQFEARIFHGMGNNPGIISITKIPRAYDDKPVVPPPGYTIQGLPDEEETAETETKTTDSPVQDAE